MNLQKIFKLFSACLFLFASVDLLALPSGGPFPKFEGSVNVVVEHYEPSMWKLAPGQYLIPNSSFVYSDARQGTDAVPIIGAFLGPIGVALTAKAMSTEAAKNVDGKVVRLPNLDDIVSKYLKESVGQALAKNFVLSGAADGKAHVNISPRGLLTTGKDELTRFMVYMEARAYNENGSLVWWGRYAYGVKDAKPISGPGSWMEDEGKALQTISEEALPVLTSRIVRDLNGTPNTLNKEVKFKDCAVGAKNPVFLVDDSPSHWILHYSQSAGIGVLTQVYQKNNCTLEE